MGTLMTLVVKLLADTEGFKKSMDESAKKADDIGGKMKDVGGKMTLGLSLPIAAMGGVAINAASDLSESWNKVQVVFGDSSEAVGKFTDSASKDLGMTKQQALDAAGTVGNLFVSMGLGKKPAGDMSTSLLTLSADLASFNNLDPTEVMEKLRSGLIGQSEPLRSLGVNINENLVTQKALEMGLAATKDELSESDKVMARYALIVEQTKTAQGDFARTSDGLANSSRIVKAQFGDMAAQWGAYLLPIAQRLVTAISQLSQWFMNLPEPVKIGILIFLGLIMILGPLLLIVGQVITTVATLSGAMAAAGVTFGAVASPILIVIAVIAALVGIGYLLYTAWTQNWGGIQEKTQAVISWITTAAQNFMAWITGLWNSEGNGLRILWEGIWNGIQIAVQTVTGIVTNVVKAFQAAFRGDWYAFGEYLRKAWDTLWNGVKQAASNSWETLKKLFNTAVDNIVKFFTETDWLAVGKNIIDGIVNGIKSMDAWLKKAAEDAANGALNAIKGFLGIHSPSSVMEMEVGWQMGMGAMMGLERSTAMMTRKAPGMFQGTVSAVSGGLTVPGMSSVGGGQVAIQFVYSPAVSLADEDEVNRVIAPAVAARVRQEMVRYG